MTIRLVGRIEPNTRRAAMLVKWLKLLTTASVLVAVVAGFRSTKTHDAMLKRQWGLNHLYAYEAWEALRTASGDVRGDASGPLAPVVFSQAPDIAPVPGLYQEVVQVKMRPAETDEEIRYTLDGGLPTPRSALYFEPLELTRTTVVRCRTFDSHGRASAVATATYLVGEGVLLPVVSLVCDPVKLFDRRCGIYAHPLERGKPWQREAVVQYLLPGGGDGVDSTYLSVEVDLRVHGGWTRNKSKKSLRFRYALNAVDGPSAALWRHAASGAEARTMVLRNGGNRPRTGLRDKVFQSWYGASGRLASRPSSCLLWINGRFWGLYDLRDKVGPEVLARTAGDFPGENDYDIVRGISYDPEVLAGSSTEWRKLLTFFDKTGVVRDSDLGKASELLDLEEWTDYVLFNLYAAHQDWPGMNVTFFRRRSADACWRVYPWDHDTTFGAHHPHAKDYGEGARHDTLGWALRTEWAAKRDPLETILLRRLLQNTDYRARFAARFCDLLSSHFRPRNIEAHLDRWIAEVRSVLPREWARWDGGPENFWGDVASIRTFLRERPQWIAGHVRERLGLGALRSVAVDSDGPGRVRVGTLPEVSSPWSGEYFEGLVVKLEAVPEPGARFARWEPEQYGTDPVVRVEVVAGLELRAVFLPREGNRE